MATYNPPTNLEPIDVFNPANFVSASTTLTQADADLRYLRFPIAQGAEYLQNAEAISFAVDTNIIMNGTDQVNYIQFPNGSKQYVAGGSVPNLTAVLTAGNGASNLNITGVNNLNVSTINSSPYPPQPIVDTLLAVLTASNDAGGLNILNVANIGVSTITIADTTNTLIIDQTGIDAYITGNTTDGTIFLQTKDGGGTLVDTLTINSGSNGIIIGAKLDINGQLLDQIGSAIFVADSTTQTSAYTGAGALQGSYTNTDITIDADGRITALTNGLSSVPGLSQVLTASNTAGGLNITSLGSLGFATTSMTSAYTGGTPGTYTNTNLTIDANGKISAISNGSGGSQFVPAFHNFSNYQTGNAYGYSQGAYINWSSGWSSLDYVIIRVRATGNWGNSGSGWQNYATTSGELIIRPFHAPSGGIGSLGTPNIFWSTNSGSVVGSTGKLLYYTGAINNGTQGYFFVYGNGGAGGGASGYIQLMFFSPYITGGWEYSCTYEYIMHSTSGASITFSNGSGTNNSLP